MKHAISSTNDGQSEHMSRQIQIFSLFFSSFPFHFQVALKHRRMEKPIPGRLVEIQNPCIMPTESRHKSISIYVDVERVFQLSVPNSRLERNYRSLSYHGGDGQGKISNNKISLISQEKRSSSWRMRLESDRTAAEGEWFLNTAATSRDDNDFTEAIVDELSKVYCVDQGRLYAIGYSLGSMYTYEAATANDQLPVCSRILCRNDAYGQPKNGWIVWFDGGFAHPRAS